MKPLVSGWKTYWSTGKFYIILSQNILNTDIDTDDSKEVVFEKIKNISLKTGLHFRIYSTTKGYNAICINRLFKPVDKEAKAIMDLLGCDWRYELSCALQKSFRARITPKPERIGMAVDRGLRKNTKKWIDEYLSISQGYKTCDFIGQTEEVDMPEIISSFISVHDELTKCFQDLPKA